MFGCKYQDIQCKISENILKSKDLEINRDTRNTEDWWDPPWNLKLCCCCCFRINWMFKMKQFETNIWKSERILDVYDCSDNIFIIVSSFQNFFSIWLQFDSLRMLRFRIFWVIILQKNQQILVYHYKTIIFPLKLWISIINKIRINEKSCLESFYSSSPLYWCHTASFWNPKLTMK